MVTLQDLQSHNVNDIFVVIGKVGVSEPLARATVIAPIPPLFGQNALEFFARRNDVSYEFLQSLFGFQLILATINLV